MHARTVAIPGVILLTGVLALLLTPRRAPSYMTVEGRVYSAVDPVEGRLSPVSGAVVSNDWDTTTTTTDVAGRFAIRIRRAALDERIIVRVRAGDKVACQKVHGGIRSVSVFLDGGRFGTQKCGEIGIGAQPIGNAPPPPL